ncbi:hypothetical protein BM50_2088 [Streptococcus pneumoniae]|nr:hypothetical protein BM50_2088 [Streptococcus pneumoniae]KGI30678.1 hypothetical protein BM48_2040 [Streptococcus pneumoniae]
MPLPDSVQWRSSRTFASRKKSTAQTHFWRLCVALKCATGYRVRAPWLDSGYWIFRRKQPISYVILIILNWNRVVVRLIVFERPRLEDSSTTCLIGSLSWRFLRFQLISCFEFSWFVSQSLLGVSLIRGRWISICIAIRTCLNDITCRSWSNRFTRCHSSVGKKHQSRYRNTGSTKVVLTNGITEDLFPVIITI